MKRLIYIGFAIAIAGLALQACSSKKENTQQTQSPAMEQAHPATGTEVTYTAPDGWQKEKPASSMRKAQFGLPGSDGAANGELAVFFFPGTGGSVDANLQRWYGQFKQPDGSPTTDHVDKKTVTVNGLDVTEVFVTGTYLKSKSPMMMGGPVEEMKDYAMWAAIVETPNGPWFFKATGPVQTLDHWKPAFDQFVQTFKLES